MFNPNKFITLDTALVRAKKNREAIDPSKLPRYFLPFLNEALIGISPSELVVIGSDTGIGKTHLANHITQENAKAGRKVYLFSLEGHEDEVVNRWKWQIICREYYKNPRGIELSYQKYAMNLMSGIDEEEATANEEISKIADKVQIFDRSVQLDVNVLTQQLNLIKDAELVVIDHLHYFNMLDDKSESESITQIMRAIKDLTDIYKIPVVLVSHLRKRNKEFLPDNDDLHGSSNIAKIASTCILVSSDPENHDLGAGLYSTIFRVSKSRLGAPTSLGARVMFDSNVNQYAPSMALGKILFGKYEKLAYENYPKWAQTRELVKNEKDSFFD